MRDYARGLIKRLAGMPGAPDSKEAIGARIDALERCSKGSEMFARRVVDVIEEQNQFFPTVHDILQVARDLRDADDAKAGVEFYGKRKSCGNCVDGYIEREIQGRGPFADVTYVLLDLCPCQITSRSGPTPAAGTSR